MPEGRPAAIAALKHLFEEAHEIGLHEGNDCLIADLGDNFSLRLAPHLLHGEADAKQVNAKFAHEIDPWSRKVVRVFGDSGIAHRNYVVMTGPQNNLTLNARTKLNVFV